MADLMRTGEAARILGSSRQHVVDLIERGELTNHGHGPHRRLERNEVETLAGHVHPRDERQRLWLHRAVAAKFALDPARSMARTRTNLGRISIGKRTDIEAMRIFARWAELLVLGPEALMRGMTAETPEGDALRRTSPVVDLLTDEESGKARQGFAYVDRHAVSPPSTGMARRRVRRIDRVAARAARG